MPGMKAAQPDTFMHERPLCFWVFYLKGDASEAEARSLREAGMLTHLDIHSVAATWDSKKAIHPGLNPLSFLHGL
jgi:hypothetical protein